VQERLDELDEANAALLEEHEARTPIIAKIIIV
jgi:hypothetical protein